MDPARIEDASLAELLRAVVADARALTRVEIELATEEVTKQADAALRSGISLALSLVAASVAVSMLVVTLVLALGGKAGLAAAMAGGFALAASLAAVVGYRAMPRKLLAQTRARVREDADRLRETAA